MIGSKPIWRPIGGFMVGWFVCNSACADSGSPATGGFDETLIDQEIRRGEGFSVADVDGDGRADIVAAMSLTDAVHIYLHPDDVRDPWEPIPISGQATIVATSVAVADLDADGDIDVAAVGQFERVGGTESPGEVAWYENPGDVRGVWKRHRVLRPRFVDDAWVGGLFGARVVETGDLDGDGDEDLVVGTLTVLRLDAEDVVGGLYWFSNAGPEAPGRFDGPVTLDVGQVNDLRVTDWDGDGRLDVLTSGTDVLGRVSWYQNTPSAAGPRFVRRDLVSDGAEYVGLAMGNLDDDPADELAVTRALNGTTSIQRIDLPGNFVRDAFPVQTIAMDLLGPVGANARVTAADFNEDGTVDLVASTTGGSLYLYTHGANDVWTTRVIRTGYRGLNHLGHSDVDGDGREDILTNTFDFGFRDRLAWWRNVP